jgi:predicted metal-dependent hydrolase
MFDPRPDRYAPGDRLEVAGCPVRLKVDRRARRISLRVDAASGEVIATAPSPRRLNEAVQFASQRALWIGQAMARLPTPQAFAPGETIEILGRACQLQASAGRRGSEIVEGEELRLVAAGEGEAFGRAVERALRREALEALRERTDFHSRALGQPLPKVGIMDARSRWGSCRPAGRGRIASIRYSWRLVLAPYWVADYVAAHECAHLIHPDHSPRFWAEVKGLFPDVKSARAWLRANGPRLHAAGRSGSQ